jgi:hypothetical protein
MEKGFLTKTNKIELIETLIQPTIQQKYQLTIESIPNFTRIYDSKAREIHKLNPNNTLIEKNMLLLKDLIHIFKTKYEDNLAKINSKQKNIQQSYLDETILKNEIISDNNSIREVVEPKQPYYQPTKYEEKNNINEGLKDVELRVGDTNNMLDELIKQRDMDSVQMGQNKTDDKLETIQESKTIKLLNDNIIELDDDMTFKIKFNKTKKLKTILFKKILLLVDELDEDVLDIPYFIVTVGSNSRYFFNNGLNGNCCTFDVYLDFPIDIQNKDSLTIEINTPTRDIYKQTNVLVYLNY